MGDTITFMHSGDLHLGAPISGLGSLDEAWAARMRKAIAESYERLIRTSIKRKVDFVVLAGDVFDTTRASFGDFMGFFDGLAKLDAAGIPTFVIAGNHDPYTTWAKDLDLLPPSARLLGVDGPEFACFEREGRPLCLIGARSFFSQAWPDGKDIAEGISRRAAEEALVPLVPDAAEAPFAIGIIHTGLDFDPNKAPTSEADLLARGIDYWACGHLHRQLVRPSYQDPRIAFPGCIQARSIKESGPHGAFQVRLEEGRPPALELVPTASVALETLEVDATGCATLRDLARRIQSQMFQRSANARCDDMVVRVSIVGETDLHDYLAQPAVIEQLRCELSDAYPTFYCDSLVSHARSPLEATAEGILPAMVRDMADEQRARPAEMVNYVQSELVARGIPVPLALTRSIDEFEDAAESLALALLGSD